MHCVGGFVVTHCYGVPRSTGDIDYITSIPSNINLHELAGEGSALSTKHKLSLHRVAVTGLPEDYESRLTEIAVGQFARLKLFVPDPYDCILSKIDRNSSKDRDDANYIFRSQGLDFDVLRDRYHKELRHHLIGPLDTHDGTLQLLSEIFLAPAPGRNQ